MKKEYEIPDIYIERFDFLDVITLSAPDADDGIGTPDQTEDPWDNL